MAQKTEWTCDGCGEPTVVAKDKTPSDWKRALLSWSGLGSYPANLADGEGAYDLCPSCASRLAQQMRPTQWTRPSKEKVAPHG